MILQTVCAVFRYLRKSFAQLFVGKLATFSKEFGKVLQDLLDRLVVFGIAVDTDVVTPAVDLTDEGGLAALYVLVVNAEQRFQSFGWKLDLLQVTTRISLLM